MTDTPYKFCRNCCGRCRSTNKLCPYCRRNDYFEPCDATGSTPGLPEKFWTTADEPELDETTDTEVLEIPKEPQAKEHEAGAREETPLSTDTDVFRPVTWRIKASVNADYEVSIEDHGAGEFITLRDLQDGNEVSLDPEDIDRIKQGLDIAKQFIRE